MIVLLGYPIVYAFNNHWLLACARHAQNGPNLIASLPGPETHLQRKEIRILENLLGQDWGGNTWACSLCVLDRTLRTASERTGFNVYLAYMVSLCGLGFVSSVSLTSCPLISEGARILIWVLRTMNPAPLLCLINRILPRALPWGLSWLLASLLASSRKGRERPPWP